MTIEHRPVLAEVLERGDAVRHIVQVRDTYYSFLEHQPVPVTDANHKTFGVASVPVNILIDSCGAIRLYYPGRIAEPELDAAIQDVLER